MSDDRELARAFARLRDEELRRTPKFTLPPASSRSRMSVVAFVALVLIVVAGTLVFSMRRSAPVEKTVALTTFHSPTDFLLRTPGVDLTTSVPRLQPQLPEIKQ